MFRSIQFKLFFSYSLFIFIIILLFVTSFYLYTSKALEDKSLESIQSISRNISVQLDTKISNLNNVSKKIISSNQIKDLFFDDLTIYDSVTLGKQRLFSDLVFTILDPSDNSMRLNMFDLKGRYVNFGIANTFSTISKDKISNIKWAKDTISNNGKRLIVGPHQDDWSNSSEPVISLCRAFSKDYNTGLTAILEIQQGYNSISGIVKSSLENITQEKKVYIFDTSGNVIYPYSLNNNINGDLLSLTPQKYWKMTKGQTASSKNFIQNIRGNKGREILAYCRSDISSWTVVVIESEKTLLQPVIYFRNLILYSGLIILFVTLIISFFVARGLTIPIRKIRKSVRNLSIQTLSPNVFVDTEHKTNELEALNNSFGEMCERLKISLDEVVSSRSHEIQSRMLALQSQMNPHFLYNTLSIISILAEDERNTRIVKICDDLSNLLRYISSSNTDPVTLQQEIEHTISYINLIKIKYEDRLIFNLNIPEQLHNIYVPKLIIQPLVENCIKYGIDVYPPWKISVNGTFSPDKWEVTVKDNGCGFTEDNLKYLLKKMTLIEPQNVLPDLELDGMGLMNIYIRLRLLYGEAAVFKLTNCPEGGAMVTVGGLLKTIKG